MTIIKIDHRPLQCGKQLTKAVVDAEVAFIACGLPPDRTRRGAIVKDLLVDDARDSAQLWAYYAKMFWDNPDPSSILHRRGWVHVSSQRRQLRSDFFTFEQTVTNANHDHLGYKETHWFLDLTYLPGENFELAAKVLRERMPTSTHILRAFSPQLS